MKPIYPFFVFLLGTVLMQAQTTPAPIKQVATQYIKILRTSPDIDACATAFISIAGGNLVNETGTALRSSTKHYGLTKDFDHIDQYTEPLQIVRVETQASSSGYGASALQGTKYTLWIAKKTGEAAPIVVLQPQNHPQIHSPKIVEIGAL